MSDESKLETYLERLEKALARIPTSDRAEIVLEIKSHVHESRSKHPDDSISGILAGLGEPESVANRYLMERGLKPGKPSKSPIVKWLTIGFLGTLGILVSTALILVWNFTPIVSIKGDEGKVSILGGMISINGSPSGHQDDWQTGSQATAFKENGSFSTNNNHHRVKILFSNTKADIFWKNQDSIHWDCKLLGQRHPNIASSKGSDVVLSLANASKCSVTIPHRLSLYLTGSNGKISLNKPTSDYEIDLTNGVVVIAPDPEVEYRYDLKTTHGVIDRFDNANNMPAAKSAKVSIVNGTIKRN